MKLTKLIITIILLLFVAATMVSLIAQEVARPKMQVAETDESALPVETSVPATSEISTSEQDPVLNESAVVDEPEPSEADAAEETGESPAVASSSTEEPCVIEATYFHNTNRCVTCLKIEGDAQAIVEEVFAVELAAGRLRWVTINMEDERAYISQYELVSPSLVLIRKVGDEVADWVLLEETWALVRSTTRYSAYIIDSFVTFLEGCP